MRLATLLLALALTACGGGSDDEPLTPTATPTARSTIPARTP